MMQSAEVVVSDVTASLTRTPPPTQLRYSEPSRCFQSGLDQARDSRYDISVPHRTCSEPLQRLAMRIDQERPWRMMPHHELDSFPTSNGASYPHCRLGVPNYGKSLEMSTSFARRRRLKVMPVFMSFVVDETARRDFVGTDLTRVI